MVLGRVRKSAIAGAGQHETLEEIMEPGPSTIRPNMAAKDVTQQMREDDLRTMLVTTPEGRLLGVLRREDVEAAKHV